MASEKFMQLLESLCQATREGRVSWKASDWKLGDLTEIEFVVDLGSVMVVVEEDDQDDQYRYVVTLKTNQGKSLESEVFDFKSTDESQYKLASTLYELARKDALKIDLIIDSVINDLKKK